MRTVNDDNAAPGLPARVRRLRSAAVLTATGLALAACGGDDPARTDHLGFQDGVAPAQDSTTLLETIVVFGLVPLAILLVIAALVWLPGMVRGNRYRPARGWSAAPLWFGGPADPAAAVESAQPGDLVRGGASGGW